MAKSWLEWLTGKNSDDWDRRDKSSADLPSLDPADFDPITGTVHWATFAKILEAAQSQSAGALLVVDLNERSAALEELAEEVLPWLAQAIRQAVRAEDLVTHLYGYRFAVLLRGAEQDMAETVASRIRESVDDRIFMTAAGNSCLAVTIGGVTYDPEGERMRDIIGAAFDNLGSANDNDWSILIT